MYKPLADSTLHNMTKKEIIELLRTAEHNAKVSQEWVAQQAENLKDWKPVVPCKNCANGMVSDDSKYIICCRLGVSMDFDNYCSYGERKRGVDHANT